MTSDTSELRLDVPKDDLSVLDGYCSATGKSRSEVIRSLLAQWSADKKNEAIMICRVAGCNPTIPEPDRKANQKGTA